MFICMLLFFLSSLFDIVTPLEGHAMFHYLNQKVKLTNVNKIHGKKRTLEQIKTEEG